MDSTVGSELAKGVRNILVNNQGPVGTRTKVIERPGRTIHSMRARNNPFPRKACHRQDCPFKLSDVECKDRCSKENIVYKAVCTTCHDK